MFTQSIKVVVTTVCIMLVALGCTKNPTTGSDGGYEEYNVKIINESNREIVGISIGMVGTEYEIEIDKISAGEESSCLVFNLPVLEGEMGKSWGDLFGYYTINGSVRDFFIYNYEHEFKTATIIRVSSEYFRTEFSNLMEGCYAAD